MDWRSHIISILDEIQAAMYTESLIISRDRISRKVETWEEFEKVLKKKADLFQRIGMERQKQKKR